MATTKDLQTRLLALKKQLEEDGQPVTITDINHLLELVGGGASSTTVADGSGGGPGEERGGG